MGQQKAPYIIVLFLLIAICSNSVMGEACLCGQACRHSLTSKLEAGVNSSFHMRCCGTTCNSCNIEKGQTLKAANTFTPTGSVKSLSAIHAISVLLDYSSPSNVLKNFSVFSGCKPLPSSPIYLRNLSLLF